MIRVFIVTSWLVIYIEGGPEISKDTFRVTGFGLYMHSKAK